jgi:hypothetical protein
MRPESKSEHRRPFSAFVRRQDRSLGAADRGSNPRARTNLEVIALRLSLAQKDEMAQNRMAIEKRSEDENGETFQIIFLGDHGSLMKAQGPYSAAEVTEFFERCGQPASEVLEMVRVARRRFADQQPTDERTPVCPACSRPIIFVRSAENDVVDIDSGQVRRRLVAKVYRCADHGLVEIPQRRRTDHLRG